MRLIDRLEPLLRVLPEVQRPSAQTPQTSDDKFMWTGLALFVFLVCCQVPVFGIRTTDSGDPFHWMRVILASNRGTLMELGISPIVTSSLLLQLLHGRVLGLDDRNRRDRRLLAGAQKAFALILTVAQAVTYVGAGMYGDWREIGTVKSAMIVAQLSAAGLVCMLLDELLQRGYGYGSGISLFVATHVCETIFWKAFSPMTVDTGRGHEFEGALVAMFSQLIQSPNKLRALKESFYRTHLPNVMSLVATLAVFAVVCFVQNLAVHVNLTTPAKKHYAHKIKLFYTSNMPIVLQTAVVSNIYYLSQAAQGMFPKADILSLLGRWEKSEVTRSYSKPVSGLVYYISPPMSAADFVGDPFHVLFYAVFVMASCALLSKAWVSVSNQSAGDVARQLHDAGLSLHSHQRASLPSLQAKLEGNVSTAALLGGICIGALTVVADAVGAIGGTGVLLAVTSIHQFLEQLEEDKVLPAGGGRVMRE